MANLLIDFGASRVKTAINQGDEIFDIQNFDPVKPYDIENKKFVVSLNDIKKLFIKIVDKYSSRYQIDKILMCSEMHGFAVLDENNNPLSDYISWKDERCLNKINGTSSFEYLKNNYGKMFFEITGMKERPCYPFFNLFEYLKDRKYKKIKIVSLPEFICATGGNSLNVSHPTMAAGLGFYNIYENKFDKRLIQIFEKEFNVELLFNEVSKKVTTAGYINSNGQNISIYTGVGDHQCAVLGAGNTDETISLNLGTGSQVGMINSKSAVSEKRPFFNDKLMSVVTHIPSGRSFNAYIKFLYEINPDRDFWKMLSDITLDEIKNSTLEFDMAIFQSAWNFIDYGFIKGINEQNLTLKNYLASLLKKYISQFEEAINFIGDKRDKIILSGGVAQKIPVIKEYFDKKGYKTLITDVKIDETLNGLCIIGSGEY